MPETIKIGRNYVGFVQEVQKRKVLAEAAKEAYNGFQSPKLRHIAADLLRDYEVETAPERSYLATRANSEELYPILDDAAKDSDKSIKESLKTRSLEKILTSAGLKKEEDYTITAVPSKS